jgi:hypothetical protein
MEVQHPHNITHKKKWTEYLLEFFMLFFAVTAGFFVENLREHNVEHQRLIRFARQLVNGLKRDTAEQNQVLAALNEKEMTFDSLRYFLAMPEDDNNKWLGVYRYLYALENPFRYTYRKPVFDQINYSGSFRLFTNNNIADSLMDYVYNGTLIEWQTNTEISFISESIIPFLNLHFDKNLVIQRFDTHIKKPDWDISKVGHTIPPKFIDHLSEWKPVFENLVITAREKHELPYLNIIEERERAAILISSLIKEYDLQ